MSLHAVDQAGEETVDQPLISPEEEYAAKLSELSDAEIQGFFKEMQEQDDISAAANAKRGEIRARVKERGMASADFNASYARWKMDENARKKRDIALARCNKAMGTEFQQPLFDFGDGEPH